MILFRRLPIRYIRSFAERKQEQELKKQKEHFKTMIDELSRKEVYTLKDYRRELLNIEQKGKSFMKKLFSEVQPEEIELERSKKILNAFKDEEMTGSEKITGGIKDQVAQVTQTSIQSVNELLKSFDTQKRLHSFLKSRREKGEYIPQTSEELENMMKTDRPPITKHDIYSTKRKFSVKQKKWLPMMK